MSDPTPEDAIAAAAARSGIALPSDAVAQIAAGLAAIGGGLSAEEHAQLGPGAPLLRVAASGKVWINPKLATMRQMRQPRSPMRRVKVPEIASRASNRAPRRRRTAGMRAAESRDGPDPDPPTTVSVQPLNISVQPPNAAPAATAEVRPMSNLIRFSLRAIPAVLVLRERGEWLTLVGDHGWLFGSRADAFAEARWLSRNTGFPIRELPRGRR